MKHIASLSGGATSTGPLPTALIEKFGADNVDLVFCDTGAEHKDTYRFVRDAENMLGKKITCLKLIMPKEKNVGCRYEVCTVDDIGPDYKAWKQLTSKYGNPFIPGGKFCTDQMKTQIFKKYCNDTYGKGGFYTWIGYRYEEGNRIWGRDGARVLGKLGFNRVEMTEFYLECLNGNSESMIEDQFPSLFPSSRDEKDKNYLRQALKTIKEKNFRFMPEICSFDKGQVIAWWAPKENKLRIEEHKTNCIFCPEKPEGTLILAIKDCPDEAREFLSVVESNEVAEVYKRNGEKKDNLIMYRNQMSFRYLYEKAQAMSREEALELSNLGKRIARKNPCASGSCDPMGDIHQLEIE